jgi:hypothetical protein
MGKRKKVSIAFGNGKHDDVKLSFMALSSSKEGDGYFTVVPDFIGDSGAHLSFHKSGIIHFRIPKLGITVPLPSAERLQQNFIKVFPSILRFPEGTGQVGLIVMDDSFTAGVAVKETAREVVMSMGYAAELAMQNIIEFDSATEVPTFIQQLKKEGKIGQGTTITIHTGEEICIYKPVSEAWLASMPEWMPRDKIDLIKKYGGVMLTFRRKFKDKKELLDNPLMRLFEPYSEQFIDAFGKVIDEAKAHNKEKLDRLDQRMKMLVEEAEKNKELGKNDQEAESAEKPT